MTLRKLFRILSLTSAALALATPALALNPQPLPPGMRFRPAIVNHEADALRLNRSPFILRCHPVQVGDPRKQPPMRVCP